MRKKKKRILYAAAATVVAVTVIYFGLALFFTKHFYLNTIINGEDYSYCSSDSVQSRILDTSGNYVLTINGRDGLSDTITSADIVMRLEFADEFTGIIGEQDAFLWPLSLFRKSEYTIDTMVTYSQEELDRKIDTLCFFQPENIRQPQDAYLSDYTENGYQIIPEDKGTVPVRANVHSAVEEAVRVLAESVDLDGKNCYTTARITSEDGALQRECKQKNHFTGVTVTYTFGEDTEILDGSVIKDWLVIDGRTIDIDPELVREYVNALSKKYDTWGKKREFTTTNGETITIAEGAYGWWMDRAEETKELVEQIKSGKSCSRTPVYRAEAAQYGDDDIGDSYVEIDLTSQHLWVYADGQLVEETDLVSGNVSKGYNTPVGIYGITYKERNATLRGANYASHVSYWMPFNGNVGMHDASWRNAFGGEIYLNGGSHGCVNLPVSKAQVIFENVEKGEPVIVYGGKTRLTPAETVQEPEPDPEEVANPGFTPEQLQQLIEAGLLNPDGTPIQQPQENPGETPQEGENPQEGIQQEEQPQESTPQGEVPPETPQGETVQETPQETPQEIPGM